MEVAEIKKIYACYSRVYDFIFKRWFFPRQQHAIQALKISPGQQILDLGVGTGFSLPLYPQHARVVGVDLSSKMLREAQKKVQQKRLRHVTLLEMDASHLAFPDSTFDVVIVAFVISVVPDPLQVLAEIKRVSKPEGQIVIINHFQSQNRVMAQLEKWASPLCSKIGWRSDLALDYLVQYGNLRIDRKYSLNKLDLWKVIYATNNK
ncbi:MAG: methyltransferase domain-containing protein [Candidatus Tectomicrobia bacterium]|uniref:Methyltransferase domain-containing protein n=1 Tax=Tectimicrobiota bacterium TaxID=2528274 RepID=A0A937W346_UNCTE|nr:methyltransferase domain-containing protein [Candidatus Tectomicrobia bacterium]